MSNSNIFYFLYKPSLVQIEQTSNSCLVQWRHPVEHGSRVHEYMLEASGATTSMICTAPRPTASPSSARSSSELSSHNEGDDSFDKNNGDGDDDDVDDEMDSDAELHAVEESGGDTSSIASSSNSSFSNNKVGASSLSDEFMDCLLYTSPSPRDGLLSRMPSSA